MNTQIPKVRLVQTSRVLFAVLIPVPIILFAYVWHVINGFYHSETYQSATYWLDALQVIIPTILFAAFLAFWRFKSYKTGIWMVFVELIVLAVVGSWVWLNL